MVLGMILILSREVVGHNRDDRPVANPTAGWFFVKIFLRWTEYYGVSERMTMNRIAE